MDSFKQAVMAILFWLPLELISKPIEWLGTLYALLQYPFQKGQRKAQRVYKKIEP